MPALDKVIINGTGPVLRDFAFFESVSGPDEVNFTAQNCALRTTFSKGGAVPGYANLRIIETRAKLVPGSLWDISCRGRGLITGSSRILSASDKTNALGWDDRTEKYMELASASPPTKGTAHPSFSTMFLMECGKDESLDLGDGTSKWVQRSRMYRGLLNGETKLVSRKISGNENSMSGKNIVWDFPGGWHTGRPAHVSMPRVTVEDRILTTTFFDVDSYPGPLAPPDPPAVQTMIVYGSDIFYNWPHGWKLAQPNQTELFKGAGVWDTTLLYEYVYPAQF